MAGFFGFFDYTKPGKGVEKEDFKPSFSTFFSIFFERFWKLIQLNMIYFICSIPLLLVVIIFIPTESLNAEEHLLSLFKLSVGSLLYLSVVGIAPIITGFTYVLRNYSRDQHAWLLSDFFEHIKKNFKQASLLMLIDLFMVIMVPFIYTFYSSLINTEDVSSLYRNVAFFARTLIILASAIYFIMHFYIYQIMITFDMKLKQILKNSFIFTLAHMPRNIGILALITIVATLTFGFTTEIGILISFILSVSLIGYIVNFIVQPVISKHMIKPQEEN